VIEYQNIVRVMSQILKKPEMNHSSGLFDIIGGIQFL
jgi:hypothetical protein